MMERHYNGCSSSLPVYIYNSGMNADNDDSMTYNGVTYTSMTTPAVKLYSLSDLKV